MSKKFTSFLVLAAALLLTVPAQAQFAKKQAKSSHVTAFKAGPQKAIDLKKARDARLKAESQVEGVAFTGKAFNLLANLEKAQEDKAALKKLMEQNFDAIKANKTLVTSTRIARDAALTPLKSGRRAGETGEVIDEHGIIISPAEGEEQVYTRAGEAYYSSDQSLYFTDQSGTVTIVETEDGTVYIKDIVSLSGLSTWVKGIKSGSTITVPIAQPVYYNGNYDATLSVRWGHVNAEGLFALAEEQPEVFTFTINDNVISLQGTAAYQQGVESDFMGIFWDDDNSFTGFGDAESVWTKIDVITHVDELPFTPSFDDVAIQASFAIIDANEDGKTWSFEGSNAKYTYNSSLAADDWLISPAIKLEAGKNYYFGIDAKCNGYTEKFEVMMGKEGDPILAQTVIDKTIVTNEDFITYENEFVTVAETGYYYIGIHAISDPDQWNLFVTNFVVKEGAAGTAPAAVTDLTVEQVPNEQKVAVSFNAPMKAVDGSYLRDNIAKIEILRNDEVIETMTDVAPGAAINYVDDVPALGLYTYQVIPYDANGAGQKSAIKEVMVVTAVNVPYTFDFSTEDVLDLFQIIDANEDGKTWAWNSTYASAFYSYNSSRSADDYMISVPVKLNAGKNYNVIVSARAGISSYPERFEVKIGKQATVDGLNQTVIEPTDVAVIEPTDYEGVFSVTEDGDYFIAVHAISDADMATLRVLSLTIEASADAKAPAAISDFTATPGAQGALEANLAFTAPSKAVDGSNLTGTVDVKVYRDNVLVNTLTDIAVGSATTWKDTDVEDGKSYTYYLVAANAAGDGLKSEKVSVFVGQDELNEIDGVEVTGTTANTISLSWNEATGVNGGYVDLDNVKYAVVSMHVEVYWIFSYLVVDDILGVVTGETSGTFNYATDEGEQGYKYFGVMASKNEEGLPEVGDQYAGGYNYWLVGAPYTLPFRESFVTDGEGYLVTGYSWAVEGSDDTAGFIVTDASDGDDAALMMTTVEEAGAVMLTSGKISLKGAANPTLLFDMKGVGVTTAEVLGSKDEGEWEIIKSVDVTSEYTTVNVPLIDHNGERFIRFAIATDIENPAIVVDMDEYDNPVYEYHDQLFIDNIKVMDLYQYNLKAEIEAPASVVAGKTAKVVATVINEGENPASNYKVTVKAGEKVLTTVLGSEELAPFAKDVIPVDFETSVFDEPGDVTLTATVEYDLDLNPDDNTATTIITIKKSTAPTPESFTATDKGNDGVDLAWTAPEIPEYTYVTEGFEIEDDLGGFTLIDADGDGYNWMSHMNVEGEQGQFITHTGNGCVFSQSYINNVGALTPDNWLVTPLAVLAGEFSFWACGQDPSYAAEHFAVYVSTTSATDPSAFTKVSDEFIATGEMTEYKVDLSAYAGQTGYIAIRHYNVTDMYYLNVDDVTYIPAFATSRAASAVSYNVYYEGNKIATVAGDKTSYTVPGDQITAGSRTFGLTAVYADGSESAPVTADVEVTTGINQIATDGKPVDIYAIDGKLVRRQAKSFDGLKGLYIVNGKKVLIK